MRDADGREVLRATQTAFRAAAASVAPSVVRIDTVGGAQPRDPLPTDEDVGNGESPRRPTPFRDSLGSDFVIADGPTTGLIYSADGYIVAGSFNFVRDPFVITATLSDGRRLPADLIARDQVRKIALLKVDAEGLPVPTWIPQAQVRVGQWAIALGVGFGESAPAITRGIVSAKGRMHGNAIQTDARLSPVNYGGPLCDVRGRVMGLCVPMAQQPGELAGAEMYDSGVGFALPKDRVDAIVSKLMTGESVYRGWLGMEADPHHADGVVIGALADGSPLAAAGAEPGDRIVRIEGKRIGHFGQLQQALYMVPAGESVRIELDRDGKTLSVTVTLARADALGALPIGGS